MSSSERTVTIVNALGLHARAAAKFVRLAEGHGAAVTVSRDEAEVCGTSIMDLLMLAASRGTAISIRAEGEGADRAVAALAGLVESGFGE